MDPVITIRDPGSDYSQIKWFRHTRGHCETFPILTTIFRMVYQYSAKVSQSQPLYQFTLCVHCTSASKPQLAVAQVRV